MLLCVMFCIAVLTFNLNTVTPISNRSTKLSLQVFWFTCGLDITLIFVPFSHLKSMYSLGNKSLCCQINSEEEIRCVFDDI